MFGGAVVCALLLAIPGAPLPAQPAGAVTPDNSLYIRIGEETYRAMGLHKLTDSERRLLSEWLDSQLPEGSGAASSSVAPAEFGFPEPPPDALEGSETLQARILPPFRGWDGRTIFRLDNGQVWQQRVSGRYTYLGDDTRVEITRNRMGFYELRLVSENRMVGVKRLE